MQDITKQTEELINRIFHFFGFLGRVLGRGIVLVVLLLVGVGVVISAPAFPADMEWVVSYETTKFDTRDGDLGVHQYAKTNEGYFVRTLPKDKGQFETTTDPRHIQGKEKVSVLCGQCAYYSEFRNASGEIVRVPMEKYEYEALRSVANAPQPKRTEMINFLNSIREAEAAVAVDTTANSTMQVNVSSVSYSHTVSGSNRALTANISYRDINTNSSKVSVVTYNGDSLSSEVDTFGASLYAAEIWAMAGPDTGSNTVSVTFSEEIQRVSVGSVSLTGVDQTDPAANGASKVSANSDTSSLNIFVSTAESVVVDAFMTQQTSGGTPVATASGQTQRWSVGAGQFTGGGSTRVAATTGSNTFTWDSPDNDGDDDWAHSALVIVPGEGGGTFAPWQFFAF